MSTQLAFISIFSAVLITMVTIAIQRPWRAEIAVTANSSFYQGFVAVADIVFAYGKHLASLSASLQCAIYTSINTCSRPCQLLQLHVGDERPHGIPEDAISAAVCRHSLLCSGYSGHLLLRGPECLVPSVRLLKSTDEQGRVWNRHPCSEYYQRPSQYTLPIHILTLNRL